MPREDYKELLELLIINFSGAVTFFCFKMSGADHHARWMSKVIYNLKIFEILPEEQDQVNKMSITGGDSPPIFCLEFMDHMLQYRLTAFAVMQFFY